jgi:hypothetical protein
VSQDAGYFCPCCGKEFRAKKSISWHMDDVHSNPSNCPHSDCDYMCRGKRKLRYYLRKVHGTDLHSGQCAATLNSEICGARSRTIFSSTLWEGLALLRARLHGHGYVPRPRSTPLPRLAISSVSSECLLLSNPPPSEIPQCFPMYLLIPPSLAKSPPSFPALLALCFTRLFGALVCFVIRSHIMSLPSLSFPALASIKPALQRAES